jgi:Zn-dependent protease with chaperone function
MVHTLAQISQIRKPPPQSTAKAPRVERLSAEDFRVPNEQTALWLGAVLSGGIAMVTLLFFAIVGMHLPPTVSWIIVAIMAGWIVWPHIWLWLRARQGTAQWAALASTAIAPPRTRVQPQTMVHDICVIIDAGQEPKVRIVPGQPAIASLPGFIYLTEELYQQTADRDLLMLLLHEAGHLFAGHVPFLPLARALPVEALEGWWQVIVLAPALPWLHALREWSLWADVTADRFSLIIKSDIDLALLAVMKQEVLCAPDSQSRAHLLRFLGAADSMLDRGEQFLIGTEITDMLSERPELDTRIANLRAWQDSEVFTAAVQRLRKTVAARGK